MIFRIDDVSVNTDIDKLEVTIQTILNSYPTADIMLAISLIVFDREDERMNDGKLNVLSDHRVFYKGSKLGMPDLGRFKFFSGVSLASHGFLHVDHRLLGVELQEWNIVQSCAIICPEIPVFVPPRHKWDYGVEEVCEEHDIELIKVEDGWEHLKYKDERPGTSKYYFHTYDFNEDYLLLGKL
jgi:hypothetical protein